MNKDQDQHDQTEHEKTNMTPEQQREAELKKKIEELRKRDPFIYR